MCGNNDGSSRAELLMENNAIAGNVMEFGTSWAINTLPCEARNIAEPVRDTCLIQNQVWKSGISFSDNHF